MLFPIICRVAVNDAKTILGSYLDPEYVFHLIEGGRWRFTLENREFEVDRNCLLLLPPRILHLVDPIGKNPGSHRVIHFRLDRENDRFLRSLPRVVRVHDRIIQLVSGYFHALLDAHTDPADNEWTTAGYLWLILSEFRKSSDRYQCGTPTKNSAWHHVESALKIIHAEHTDPLLDVRTLAGKCGLSPAHFSRIFKASTGMPASDYLRGYRLEKAQEYLLNSGMSCAEVAETCGFSDPYVFSKVFRSAMGIPPLRWKTLQQA